MKKLTKYEELQRQIGIRIRLRREAQQMTQAQLAKNAGISRSYVNLIETGHQANISFNALCAIADALDTTVQNLVIHINAQDEIYAEDGIDIYAEEYKEDADELIASESTAINTYYPPNCYSHTISSLMEFILYLPLINTMDLRERLRRIAGDIIGREDYICDLLDRLVKNIPESPAKEYADKEYERIQNKRNYHSLSNEIYHPDDLEQEHVNKHKVYEEMLQLQYELAKASSKSIKLAEQLKSTLSGASH